jgi:hypothetical protein
VLYQTERTAIEFNGVLNEDSDILGERRDVVPVAPHPDNGTLVNRELPSSAVSLTMLPIVAHLLPRIPILLIFSIVNQMKQLDILVSRMGISPVNSYCGWIVTVGVFRKALRRVAGLSASR